MADWLDPKYCGIKYLQQACSFFRTCQLCEKRKKLSRLKVYELYPSEYSSGNEIYYFHIPCVKKVVNDPEQYSNEQVDIALKIIEIIQQYYKNIERNSSRKNNLRRSLVKKAMELDPDLKRRILPP